MITKGLIKSINNAGNRCVVRLPLFENASSTANVEIEALVSITPGLFNNLFVDDVVFVTFEENALEKPVIVGKLYRGTNYESETNGGAGIIDTLTVRNKSYISAERTNFIYGTDKVKNPELLTDDSHYYHFQTPKEMADYILWLEDLTKSLISQLEEHFTCFKNWTQWQLKPENVEIDDGDIDAATYKEVEPQLYQAEGKTCKLCGDSCTKDKTRCYSKLEASKRKYPNINI